MIPDSHVRPRIPDQILTDEVRVFSVNGIGESSLDRACESCLGPGTTQPSFAFGNPVSAPCGATAGGATVARGFDITPDGQLFIGVIPSGQSQTGAPTTPQIHVVLN